MKPDFTPDEKAAITSHLREIVRLTEVPETCHTITALHGLLFALSTAHECGVDAQFVCNLPKGRAVNWWELRDVISDGLLAWQSFRADGSEIDGTAGRLPQSGDDDAGSGDKPESGE
jgi:hypothetical protein